MNFSFLHKLLLILIVITISCDAKDCDYSCLSKTYSYKDVSVTFTAKQVDGINYLTINLVGDNINESEPQQISVTIGSNSDSNTYYCERTQAGQTNAYFQASVTSGKNGSSIYQNKKLSCSWIMSRDDMTYPQYRQGSAFNFEFDSDFNIALASVDGDINTVAESTSELPIYQMKFLKCCNKAYGNDKVQLFVRQTDKSNEFNVFPLVDGTAYLTVVLTDSESSSLDFEVYFAGGTIDSYIQLHDGSIFYIDSQFLYEKVASEKLGTWLVPLTINGLDMQYDTRKRVYDLQILLDGKLVYTEKGLSFSSSSTQISNLFIVFSAFVIHQVLWN